MTIAGSDCSGGAGVQADLKTFSALGVYGMSAVTAITAQNTLGVYDIMAVTPLVVGRQIDAVFDDIRPDAVKIGMLFNKEIIDVVADKLRENSAVNVVLDPVMISTSGSCLLREDAIDSMIERLFPIADIITPNRHEAEHIASMKIESFADMLMCGSRILDMGAGAVLIKGGHFDVDDMTDYLFAPGLIEPLKFTSRRVPSRNTHGTGCTLSSAIAAYLSLGYELVDAVGRAKEYLSNALSHGADIAIGGGHGPVNHFYEPHKLNIKQL